MTFFRPREGSIRGRFILVVLLSTLPFFVAVTLTASLISLNSRARLQEHIESSTSNLHNLIDSMLRSSIKSYLKSKIETGLDLVENTEGGTGPVIDTLLSLQVGETGYFYAVDSNGVVIFHPDDSIVGTDQSPNEPVPGQLEQRKGYYEYMWQNTFEDTPRKKALFMSYIPELDWILTATSYREEFTSMIDIEALRESVSEVSIGETGYSYIIDRTGNVIVHPYLSRDDPSALLGSEEYETLISNLFAAGEGFTTYLWRDTTTTKMREKIVNVSYLPDFDWVIGTAIYRGELNRPIITLVITNSVIALIVAVVLFLIIYRINTSIETQLSHIRGVLRQSVMGRLSIRTEPVGPSEIRELAENLNHFLDSLEEKTRNLSTSLKEKDILIREIQHRVKNNLQTISSLLNLQKSTAGSDETRAVLTKTQNRINSMAIVYDQILLDNGELEYDGLENGVFLQRYISSIVNSFSREGNGITVTTHFDTLFLRRNQAISLGLIVNELLSNSFEHAFEEGESGEIEISCIQETPDLLLLTVRDTGSRGGREGLSDTQNQDPTPGSLDTELVRILVEQLNGSSRVFEENGFEYQIRFPASQ
jgi:two-component sensor histidine kinase/signal transduction histidine kinase